MGKQSLIATLAVAALLTFQSNTAIADEGDERCKRHLKSLGFTFTDVEREHYANMWPTKCGLPSNIEITDEMIILSSRSSLSNLSSKTKRQLAQHKGKAVRVKDFTILLVRDHLYIEGGPLLITNRRSSVIGNNGMRIVCALYGSQADRRAEAETKARGSLTGKIQSYSKREGLIINPCSFTKKK